jgi:hypothetical protein
MTSLTLCNFSSQIRCTKFCGALPTISILLRSSQRLRQAFSVQRFTQRARCKAGVKGQGGILKKSYRHLRFLQPFVRRLLLTFRRKVQLYS